MDRLIQDLRYALRSLKNQPGFAIAVFVTLTLAIAANTAVFSVVNAVLVHPLAFKNVPDPSRLVALYEKMPSLPFMGDRLPPRHKTVGTWQQQAHSFDGIGVSRQNSVTVEDTSHHTAQQVDAELVSPNYLSLFGIRPRLGRAFTKSNAVPGQGQIVLISDSVYQKFFARDPQVLGRELLVNGHLMRVVGVLPPDFRLPSLWGGLNDNTTQIIAPLDQDPFTDKDQQMDLTVYAQLRSGVSLEQARAELSALALRLQRTNATDYANVFAAANLATDEDVSADVRRALLTLQAAVFCVLLIACANVGNLLLTRAVARDKETAVRLALGAGPWRLIQQVLWETLLLSTASGIAGIAGSFGLVRWISAIAPDVHGFHEVRVDGPVLLFTAALCLVTAFLFALPAIWRAYRTQVNETLTRSSRSVSGSSTRLRSALAAAQFALSVMLLIGAGLLIRSLHTLLAVDLGFDREHLEVLSVTLPELRYNSDEATAAFNRRMLQQIQALPGLESVAFTTGLPMRSVSVRTIEIVGRQAKPNEQPSSNWANTTPEYFRTLRIPVLRGRVYTAEEVARAAPVLVVNQRFATQYWPGQDALGKKVRTNNVDYTIVGIVGNERQLGPDSDQSTQIYAPSAAGRQPLFVVRTFAEPSAYAGQLRAALNRVDSAIEPEVKTEDVALDEWLAPRRFNMNVVACLGGVAIVLAAIGLYSVLAYSVNLRRREIGIRLAIGADPKSVTALVVKGAMRIMAAGMIVGLASSLAIAQLLQSLLFGVSNRDPLTYASVCVLLAAVAIGASYLPARRASRIDPVEALRQE